MTEIVKGTTHFLELFITNSAGNPATGLSVSYKVEKSSDDSLVVSGSMNEIGGGWYKSSIVINTLGQYRVTYTTPSSFTDQPEFLKVVENDQNSLLSRILGLSQENQRIFSQSYDDFGNMTFAKIRLYPSALDVDTDSNHIAEYTFEAEYDLIRTRNGFIGLAKNVKVKKI